MSTAVTAPPPDEILLELEKRYNIPTRGKEGPALLQVVWNSLNADDMWLFLSSLSNDRLTYLPHRLKSRTARPLPVRFRYGDTVTLTIALDGKAKQKPCVAFDLFDFTDKELAQAVKAGTIELGSKQAEPYHFDDLRLALRIVADLLVDDPGDLSAHVESVACELPYPALRGIDLSLFGRSSGDPVDVYWLAVPPEKTSAAFRKQLSQAAADTGTAAVIPVLTIPWDVLDSDDEMYRDTNFLDNAMTSIEDTLRETLGERLLPMMPLYRNAFLPDDREHTGYETQCLTMLWRMTHATGTDATGPLAGTTRRIDTIFDEMMKSPSSLTGLLRLRHDLATLKSLTVPTVDAPGVDEISGLRGNGIGEYVRIATGGSRRTPDDWPCALTFPWLNETLSSIERFCRSAESVKCFSNESEVLRDVGDKSRDTVFNIAVTGHFKAGKTAFVNALLGRDYLHIDQTPAYPVPWRVRRGDTLAVDISRHAEIDLTCLQVGADAESATPENSSSQDSTSTTHVRVAEVDAITAWVRDGVIDPKKSYFSTGGDDADTTPLSSKKAQKIIDSLSRYITGLRKTHLGALPPVAILDCDIAGITDGADSRLEAHIVFTADAEKTGSALDKSSGIAGLHAFQQAQERPAAGLMIDTADIYLPLEDAHALSHCTVTDMPAFSRARDHIAYSTDTFGKDADCFIALLELSGDPSAQGSESFVDILAPLMEDERPVFWAAAKGDRIGKKETADRIAAWTDRLTNRGITVTAADIPPISALTVRNSGDANAPVPPGHTAKSVKALNENFQSLAADVRDYIETRCGMERMLQFASAISGVIENTHARLDRARKSLDRSLHGIQDRDITPELIDETERAVTFWREQAPEILEDISFDIPEEETIELLIDTKRNFDVYLSTSPDSEAGFNECRKVHWPKIARESMKSGCDLLENTLSEWHRALGGIITRIETLRMEYLPDEPSLSVPEPISGDNMPVLQVSLAVPVTKRPGIMSKFFAQKEIEAWRNQTIRTFNQKVNKALEDFQSGMSMWLKSARVDVKNMIKGLRQEAEQNGDLAEERLKEYRALISDSGRAEREKKLADIKRKGGQVEKLAAQLDTFEEEWRNIKETIIARDTGA